ncbi:fibronectin type III domain-containing protein [Curtobacterium sp. PhB170]|uniref:fibronectin type III domain-containing protein n=1 Tax=Curtobacterium sp. PhB170 TaxID=2485194 RepID=UPI00161C2DBE|nr:fibronectin type III domain-containing protein [Curtobacterium sp. PhB170]
MRDAASGLLGVLRAVPECQHVLSRGVGATERVGDTVYKAVLTAAVAAVLIAVGVALPAQAVTHSSTPGAPTVVRVTGTGGDADLTWRAPSSGAKVTGWRVQITPAEQQPDQGVDRLRASARSDHFGALTTRTTYSFTVQATGSRGTGPAVTVRYTATGATSDPTTQSLYALDASGSVVRFPSSGTGPATTVAPNGAGYAADDRGDVFVPAPDSTSITMYPVGGGAPKTIATGLHIRGGLSADVAGNLYWVDSTTSIPMKLPVTGAPARSAAAGAGTPARGVIAFGRDGTVATLEGTTTARTATTIAPNGVVTTRSLTPAAEGTPFNRLTQLIVGPQGDLYFTDTSGGGAGYQAWNELPAGATTTTPVDDRFAFELVAANSTSFFLLRSAQWCAAISEGSPNGCNIDRAVHDMLVRDADEMTRAVSVSGVQLTTRFPFPGAAAEDGVVYVDIADGATPGLWRIPAGGGAAQQLSTAQFTRLTVM